MGNLNQVEWCSSLFLPVWRSLIVIFETIFSFSRKPFFKADALKLLKRFSSIFFIPLTHHLKRFVSCPKYLLGLPKRWIPKS